MRLKRAVPVARELKSAMKKKQVLNDLPLTSAPKDIPERNGCCRAVAAKL
jgi:hypothetical protein